MELTTLMTCELLGRFKGPVTTCVLRQKREELTPGTYKECAECPKGQRILKKLGTKADALEPRHNRTTLIHKCDTSGCGNLVAHLGLRCGGCIQKSAWSLRKHGNFPAGRIL